MRFREHQASARSTTRRLVVLFVLTIALTVLGVNAALALAWRLVMVDLFGTPRLFYEVNTAMTLLFVLGGWWLESLQLKKGGAHVAQWLGGREVTTPRDLAERRFRNVVHEMAIASGLPMPRAFVLDREDTINAFASGWEASDSAITVTQGALLRLTRDELQGVVAHEFGHIQSGDTRLNMRLIGMVFGLQMVTTLGQTLAERNAQGQHTALAPLGWALMGAGSIGWLAGRLLKAAVSRQREFLADAHAVQFTRLSQGLGQALLKVAGQRTQGQRLHHPRAELVSHLLLSSDVWARGGWLATHPPLAERIRRLLGRVPANVPAEPVSMADEPDLSAPAFSQPSALAPLSPLTPATAALHTPRASLQTGPWVTGLTSGAGFSPALRSGGSPDANANANAHHLAQAVAVGAATPAPPAPQPDCLTLPPWSPPSAIREAVLAFVLPTPPASLEQTKPPQASPVQATVWALPPRQRLPWLEHALHRARSLSPEQQAHTLREAEALVPRGDRAPLREFWVLCLIRHTLSHADALSPADAATPPTGLPPRRTLTLADTTADIWRVSLALGQSAQSAQWDESPHGHPHSADAPAHAHAHAHAWATAVFSGLGWAVPRERVSQVEPSAAPPPDHPSAPHWAELSASLQRLAQLGPMQQPGLVKQWAQRLTPAADQPLADALRCVCGLIGSPMPPTLGACFDELHSELTGGEQTHAGAA